MAGNGRGSSRRRAAAERLSGSFGRYEILDVVGHGAMGDEDLWIDAYYRNEVAFEAYESHNLALELLVTTGTIGFALMGGALAWTAARLWRRRRWGPEVVEAAAVFVFLLGFGVTESVLGSPVPLFGALGVVMAVAALTPEPGRVTSGRLVG